MNYQLAERVFFWDMAAVALLCLVFGWVAGRAWLQRKRLHEEPEAVLCGYHASLLDRPFFNRRIDGANCQECSVERVMAKRPSERVRTQLRLMRGGDDA